MKQIKMTYASFNIKKKNSSAKKNGTAVGLCYFQQQEQLANLQTYWDTPLDQPKTRQLLD